jgi:hypothetical protein
MCELYCSLQGRINIVFFGKPLLLAIGWNGSFILPPKQVAAE